MPIADPLLAEARRLRFSDPRREARYRREHILAGVFRERGLLIFGLFSSTAAGILELQPGSGLDPQIARNMEFWRFGLLTPASLFLLLATFHRGFARHGHALNAIGAILSTWGLGLLAWEHHRGYPQSNLTLMLVGTVNLCLLASSLGTPMIFRWLATAMTGSAAGLILWFQFMLPADSGASRLHLHANFLITAFTMTAIGWFREAGDRRAFVQREKLDTLNAELARLNSEKNEFMAIAAHDLRAPLANIRALSELLRDDRLAEPARRRLAAENIHDQAGRVLSLVNNYLGSLEAEQGRLPVQLSRIDLANTVAAARERHEPAALAKNQSIRTAGSSIFVNADPALLAQVVDNFLANALKFSPAGSAVRLEVQTSPERAAARLAVIDQGPGIDPRDQPGLFRRFARLSARPTAGEPSTGLGLAVAKRLAEAMDASVGCDSQPGQGTVFWIEFAIT